jgi:hypothetical protein
MLTSAASDACKPADSVITDIQFYCLGLHAFFAHNSYAYMCRLYHSDIVAPVANGRRAQATVRLEQKNHGSFLCRGAAAADLN